MGVDGIMDILPLVILLTPILFSLSYFVRRFRLLHLLSASITVVSALLLNIYSVSEASFFLIDSLNRIIVLTVATVYLLSVTFGLGYHSRMGESRNLKFHMSLIDLFASSMLFSLMVNDFGLLWIGVEATTVSSALLLVIEMQPLDVEAAWRYVIIVSAGLTIGLISVIMLYYVYGSLTISTLLAIRHASTIPLEIAAATALIGYGTKIGLVPMHTWLPDAHSRAPSEVSAMFSGVLLPVAVYAVFRVYQVTFSSKMEYLFLIFALATVVISAFILASQRDLKRMFAYSTMENMGMMVTGFIIGGAGFAGALVLLVSHAFGKAGAFYSSGNILESYQTREMSRIGNLKENMPYTTVSLLFSSLSVTGSPPFGTFIGEFLIILSLYMAGLYVLAVIIAISLVIAFASVNFKVAGMIFTPSDEKRSEAGISQRAVAIAAVVLSAAVTIIFFITGGYHIG